jgi:hypothetical protein
MRQVLLQLLVLRHGLATSHALCRPVPIRYMYMQVGSQGPCSCCSTANDALGQCQESSGTLIMQVLA